MSIQHRIDGVLVTGKVSVPQDTDGGLVSAAERGAIGRGGVTFEDPDGTFDLTAWRNYTVDDTAATPTRVFTGRIIDRNIGRGNQPPAGAARVYDCTVEDQNGLLHMVLNRIIDNDAKRPAETDVARVAWLLTSRALDTIVFDEGLVSALNPGAFLASDCRRRFADDVMAEMAPSAVKNFFVYRDETSGNPALFYDKDTAAVWAAGIAISNDIADVDDNTVFFPDKDAVLQRGDPADGPYTGVDYGWQGEGFFVESAATIAAYDMRREIAYDNPRAGILATAQANAAAWLNVHANETDFITVSLLLPASHVNTVYAGQEIDVKFTHMPGYEDFVTTRVRRRTARPVVSGKWALDLELWVPSTPANDSVPGGDCPTLVQMAIGPYSNALDLEVDFAAPVTPGNIIVSALSRRGPITDYYPRETGTLTPLPFTQFDTPVEPNQTDPTVIQWRVATGVEQHLAYVHSQMHAVHYEIAGLGSDPSTLATVISLTNQGPSRSFPLGTLGGDGSLVVYIYCFSRGDTTYTITPATDYYDSSLGDHPTVGIGHASDATTVDASSAGSTFESYYGGMAVALPGSGCGAAALPILGEPVGPETATGDVDGVNTEFSTAGPFIAGTLRVFHDGINETTSIVTQDAVAGTFELDYAPRFGAVIEAEYESA